MNSYPPHVCRVATAQVHQNKRFNNFLRARNSRFFQAFRRLVWRGLAPSILLSIANTSASAQQTTPLRVERKAIPLSTSKQIYLPAPGLPKPVNSFPVSFALSPDGRYAVIMNDGYGTADSGFHQSLAVLDLETNDLTDFPDARLGREGRQSYFIGLKFSPDGNHIFASMGSIDDPTGEKPGDTGDGIAVYSFDSGKIAPESFLKIALQPVPREKIAAPINRHLPGGVQIPYPAGIAWVGSGADRLLVADNLSDDALLIDARSGNVLQRFDLSTDKVVPGSYPYGVAVTHDGKRAYVSLWNASRVAELDLETGAVARLIPLELPPNSTMSGSHPTALLLNPDETLLYVALANVDEVAVVSTRLGVVVGRISTRLPGQDRLGGFPNSLAQSADGNRVYVANAGTNSIAVVDLSEVSQIVPARRSLKIRPLGFIPTEWYPTALAVHGDDLLVATGKGLGPGPNAQTAPLNAHGEPDKHPYIFELLHGSVARFNRLDAEKNLDAYTQEAVRDNFIDRRAAAPNFPGGKSPIHHVIYIIKENRTYDQVLGDLKEGNGDPSLVMYGEDITPNEHKIAREFGILDNLYASGEVSGDGHNWSTAGVASDYLEKTVQISYRNDERLYDYEGAAANRYPLEDDMPDVNETGSGYIWTDVAHHGFTYRHYGEFISTEWCGATEPSPVPAQGTATIAAANCRHTDVKPGESLPPNLGQPHGSPNPYPWAIPLIARNIATKRELRGHFDPKYADFQLAFPDQLRVDEFLNEFGRFVAAKKTGHGGELPNYVLLRLPNDHTSGTRPGFATPAAAVADNDLAVGRVVDAVSHSPYWDDTAILIVEDDAQNGPDHVDAHRTTAYVVSKYSPSSAEKPYVESGFYTTVALVRTLEVLLGLPPMNVNDAHSPWISPLFSGPGNHAAFEADYRNRDNGLIYKMNPKKGPDAEASAALDFSAADRADSARLNEILWRDRMGDRPMPAPRHSVFPASEDFDPAAAPRADPD